MLSIGAAAPDLEIAAITLPASGKLAERYLGASTTAHYLIRPDQVIAARWTNVTPDEVREQVNAIWGLA